MRISLLVLILTYGLQVQAKTFSNSYLSFELPDNWNCVQEGKAWSCSPTDPLTSKESIIVIAAKVAGPEDNINFFQAHLSKPKTISTKVGTPMPSQVMYSRPRMLAGLPWVQAQHVGSEIQDYYTLYLATVKEQLAILISFSAERQRYQVYNPIFDQAIKSLRITASQQLLMAKGQKSENSEVIGINIPVTEDEAKALPSGGKKTTAPWLILALGAAALAGVAIYMTSTRKKQVSHSKNRKSGRR